MQHESTANPTLGKLIHRQRRVACLTQAALAAEVGVTQAAVAKWESDASAPALRHRRQLAAALGVHPSFLFPERAAA